MESANVLAQYLALFTSDFQEFKEFLAPNSALDWFGRTARGHAKINDFLRYNVLSKYEHKNFEKVASCEQIEHKPTHLKTKTVVTNDKEHIKPLNRVAGVASSLKTYADSDLDEDDSTIQPKPQKTSNNTSLIEELTPPSSIIKPDVNVEPANEIDSDDCEDVDFMERRCKRLKRSPQPPFSYLRRLTTTTKRGDSLNASEIRLLLKEEDNISSDSDEEEAAKDILTLDAASEYTPLQYITTEGVLCATKHKNNSATWDLPVRIRISYRRRKSDQQLQFALLIYEHQHVAAQQTIKPHLRRNLMAEFAEAPESTADINDVTVQDIFTPTIVEEQTTVDSADIDATMQMEMSMTNSDLEQFTIVPLRTPTKTMQTPPATPKRKSRHHFAPHMSGLKRLHTTPSTSADAATTPKRSAARNLRL